jgi:hypothetical protein
MEAGKFSFKFSRQTQKNLVGSSKYAYFSSYDFDQFFPVGRTPTLVVMILINSFRSGSVTGELHCKIPICIAKECISRTGRQGASTRR